MSTKFDPRDYSDCLVKPMTRDGDHLVSPEHVIDATIVAAIAFFTILIGDAVVAWSSGGSIYLSLADVRTRLITATLAFGLTFFAQWARARGVELKQLIDGSSNE